MVDLLVAVSIAVNVLLVAFWPKDVAGSLEPEPIIELAKPKLTSKPFRARKAFREMRREFEDAHDPWRMSQRRVEKFAKKVRETR